MSIVDGSYEDILNTAWDDIPESQVLPVGPWMLRGRNAKYMEAVGDGNPTFMFVYQPVMALEGVDEDQLADLGADYDPGDNRIFFKMWVETGADLDAVRKHLAKHTGIEVTGKNIGESLKAFKGSEITSYLDSKTYVNKAGDTVVDNDPKSFAPVED